MTDTAERSHRCPSCKKDDGLWEGVTVPGWRSIDAHLTPATSSGDRDTDWSNAERDGTVGCSCGWEGTREGLEVVGLDGEPLPAVHPNQLELEAA